MCSEQIESLCRAEKKPLERKLCNTHPCSEWSTGDWGYVSINYLKKLYSIIESDNVILT